MSLPATTTSLWADTAPTAHYPALDAGDHVDVVIVGGGVTGLTAAYLLTAEGRRVAVLERGRCGAGDTGHTTAHLTMVTDIRLRDLEQQLGRSHAQAVWDAGLAAIAQIEALVSANDIACAFGRVDGYLHAPVDDETADAASFREEAELAASLGFDAAFEPNVPLAGRPGIRFAGQARIDAGRYLAALAQAVLERGGRIHEHTAVDTFHEDPTGVTANGHRLTCDEIVLATHNPLVGLDSTASASLFQTKLALYSSYALAARVPRGHVPDALWWDTADPYDYVRVLPEADHDLVIFGGQDHKTGQVEDTASCHARLEAAFRRRVPDAAITHRWSGQVIETPDGLPFIGRNTDHQFIATGYAGNGMTFGTLAGMMAADAIVGRRNPWADLFAPDRPAVRRGVWDYLTENVDYPYYMIRDRFAGVDSRPLRAVGKGEGAVVEHRGQKVAAHRDGSGVLHLRSAICTHMGCTVAWNTSEQTWDCPCHGSRFTPTGDVLSGPAESPLPEPDA